MSESTIEKANERELGKDGIRTRYVALDKRVPGVLYEPADERKRIGINVLVMHSDEDYLDFPTGHELARRGFPVLCANVMQKEGTIYGLPEKMTAVSAAVRWLRENRPGSTVLMGHSGGATLMSAYQAVAENGPEVFRRRGILYPFDREDDLIPADGLMLLDANWGNSVMQLFSLDPAAIYDECGMRLDSSIDLFNPQNGFRREGSSFSKEFIRRFQEAQARRNSHLLMLAQERLAVIEEGEGNFEDDEPFVIAGADQGFFNNRLFAQDPRLLCRTRGEYPLIHADGSITVEQVPSLRGPENPKSNTRSLWRGARILSVKTFLSSYAIRTEESFGYDADHVWGIDWDSCYSSPVSCVKYVKAPLLAMGMTAGWEFLAAELIYEKAASRDKSIAFVEGATHKFTPAIHREAYPGQFGDTMKLVHDYAAQWLLEGRFGC